MAKFHTKTIKHRFVVGLSVIMAVLGIFFAVIISMNLRHQLVTDTEHKASLVLSQAEAVAELVSAPGTAAVVSPAPTRSAAPVLKSAAPVYRAEPTQSSARPFLPLCESCARLGSSRAASVRSSIKTSPAPSGGSCESGCTVTSPQQPRPGKSSCPRL